MSDNFNSAASTTLTNTVHATSWRRRTGILFSTLLITLVFAGSALAQTINFESGFVPGSPAGQNGWSRDAAMDQVIHTNAGAPASFGTQSFRLSNGITSGGFNQAFTRSTTNEAGETTSANGGLSGGVRQSTFVSQFNIASVTPGAQQPGLVFSMAPDRGDGARMSYLRFEDQADGIRVYFDDFQDLAPFGTAIGDMANGCGAGGDFFSDVLIGTLDRTRAHTIKFVMTFVDGPRNDVVQIYINGILAHTGTSWEDYSRYCANSQPATVDSLAFRNAGTAVPANLGNGFLIDNFTFTSGTPATTVTNVGVGSLTPVPNANDWLFYNDENDTIDNSLGTFVTGPGTAPIGSGSVQMSVTGTQRRNIATYRFAGTPLSTINELKFSTYNPSAGNGGSANRSGYMQFNVSFDGVDNWQRRISFNPGVNGTVVQNQWQEWDAINGGGALWLHSGPTWPGTAIPGTTARTWQDLLTSYPNIKIRNTDSFFGIRVGEPYANGYTENIDAIKFGTASGTTHFNFEPVNYAVVDDDGLGSAGSCSGSDPVSTSIAGSIAAVTPGTTILICSGNYPLTSVVTVNKAVTLQGTGPTRPVIQANSTITSAGNRNAFHITAPGVTMTNLEIQKTDLPGVQELVWVQADNFTATNNLIYGPNPGMSWDSAGVVSRAFIVSVSNNVNIANNTIHTLRQPAYLNGSATSGGTITGNNVSGTKGWVVADGNFIFSGNTWGEPQNQSCDIALLASVAPNNNATYEPLLALSTNNDNAFICAQYGTPVNGRAIGYVDDSSAPNGNGSDNANYQGINAGIAGTLPGGTVQVAGGTYAEDVAFNKTVTVAGAGASSTTISGPIGGADAATVRITANNAELRGFTITRAGNTAALWNDPTLNSVGVAIQGLTVTGANVHDNTFTGNRSAIDINNSGSHTFRNNVINNNHTGVIFRNQTDNMTFVENTVTNNRTVGVLFLDASSGTNVPVQTAANGTFTNNNITGNWYGEIVDRQSGGAVPTPGTTNLKNFSGNWFGSTAPVVTTANSAEPAYAALVPAGYPGGTATDPGGQPDIAGPASANFDYSPLLNSGTDSNVETTPGRGTNGFQGNFNALTISSASAQTGSDNKVQEAVNMITAGGSLMVPGGSYPGNVNVNKAMTITGAFTVTGSFTTSASGVVLNPGNSPGIVNTGSLSLGTGTTVNMELNGTVAGANYDQFNVTGTVNIASGVTLNAILGYVPGAGHSYTIINNDGADAVTGTFAGLADDAFFFIGPNSFSINYNGGDGNDVVITSVVLCNTVSIPTGITTLTATPVTAPVNVLDTTGQGLISADFTVTYNPAVVTFTSASIPVGSPAVGSTLTVNSSTPGTLIISIFNDQPFAGAGTLVNLNFNAIGSPGSSTPVSFTAFEFNEGTPCLTTVNGLITILSGTISGTVSYGNVIGAPGPVRNIPNATLSAVGPVNVSTSTASNGTYTLSGLGAGAYTVTPSKTGDVFGAVSAFDSGLIAQFVVGLGSLNATQQTVADVSGAGGVSSFDAALIARYVALLPGSGSSGNWIFTPASRNYPNVNANDPGEDYIALLMGDVSGNWFDPGATRAPLDQTTKPIEISVGEATASTKSGVTIPVNVPDMSGRGVIAYQFDVEYNPKAVEPQLVPVEIEGTLSSRLSVTTNTETVGLIKVVVFGAMPVEGEGLLLNLKFTASGEAGTESPVKLHNFMLNEGAMRVVTTDGSIKVTAPAKDEATIEGRVIATDGSVVPGTRVVLTDSETGDMWSVYSNQAGIYRFGGIKIGRSYVISVTSNELRFSPKAISLMGDMIGVDVTAGH